MSGHIGRAQEFCQKIEETYQEATPLEREQHAYITQAYALRNLTQRSFDAKITGYEVHHNIYAQREE